MLINVHISFVLIILVGNRETLKYTSISIADLWFSQLNWNILRKSFYFKWFMMNSILVISTLPKLCWTKYFPDRKWKSLEKTNVYLRPFNWPSNFPFDKGKALENVNSNEKLILHLRNRSTNPGWPDLHLSKISRSLYRMSRMGWGILEDLGRTWGRRIWGLMCYIGEINTRSPPDLEVPSIIGCFWGGGVGAV